ncbi:MAG: hypothetical protein WKF58_02040 [Ilumatobacteraceae bacterium]
MSPSHRSASRCRSVASASKVGDAAELQVAVVDVETLGVTPQRYVLARLAARTWRLVVTARDVDVEFGIDEHGVVVDVDGFTRLT